MSKVQVETYDFGPRFSETVLSELDRNYSRRTVILAATEKGLPFGMVLMRNSDSEYEPLTATAGTGENAAPTLDGDVVAVLIAPAPVSSSSQEGLVLAGYCIVNKAGLVFDSSITDKNAAIDALESRGIIVKEA